jgi:hypothetical protein
MQTRQESCKCYVAEVGLRYRFLYCFAIAKDAAKQARVGKDKNILLFIAKF